MPESRRHHLVSRAYLRGWRPPEERDRIMVRCLPDVEARLLGTADVCVKTDWNTLTQPDGTRDRSIEEALATRVESRGIPALRDLAEGRYISWEARFDVAVFLCSLAARTPDIRDQLRVAGLNLGEEFLTDHPDAEDAVRWEQRFHGDGTRGRETAFSIIASVHTSYLTSMHWRVLRATDTASRLQIIQSSTTTAPPDAACPPRSHPATSMRCLSP